MPLLSRITTRRWRSIKGVCSSWDGPPPIPPTTARKPNRRSRRSHLLSARPRRRLPAGYFGPATLAACAKRDSEPYIATGRDPHHPSWLQRFAPLSDPPPVDASSQVKMAYKLKTALGKAIYGARTCTVEPVIAIIKEVLCFRQFSLRGELAA